MSGPASGAAVRTTCRCVTRVAHACHDGGWSARDRIVASPHARLTQASTTRLPGVAGTVTRDARVARGTDLTESGVTALSGGRRGSGFGRAERWRPRGPICRAPRRKLEGHCAHRRRRPRLTRTRLSAIGPPHPLPAYDDVDISCGGTNADGGIVTIQTASTTRASDSGGCGASFACVQPGTDGNSSGPGKHMLNMTMVFEQPGFQCDNDPCSIQSEVLWTDVRSTPYTANV